MQEKTGFESQREVWDTKLNDENWARQCAEKQLEEAMRLVTSMEASELNALPKMMMVMMIHRIKL